MRNLWVKAVLILAVVWIVAGAVIWWARSTKPTPERLVAYIERHPLEGKSSAKRTEAIDSVADQLNALSYEQRRQIRGGKNLDRFFRTLTPEEQARFLDRTLPTGFKQMMEAFNKMTPEKRRQFVEKTLAEMKKQEGEERPPEVDDQQIEKIVQEGLKSFYTDASAEVKMDFAPLIEQMQKNLQWR
jgi:hypothetical protein